MMTIAMPSCPCGCGGELDCRRGFEKFVFSSWMALRSVLLCAGNGGLTSRQYANVRDFVEQLNRRPHKTWRATSLSGTFIGKEVENARRKALPAYCAIGRSLKTDLIDKLVVQQLERSVRVDITKRGARASGPPALPNNGGPSTLSSSSSGAPTTRITFVRPSQYALFDFCSFVVWKALKFENPTTRLQVMQKSFNYAGTFRQFSLDTEEPHVFSSTYGVIGDKIRVSLSREAPECTLPESFYVYAFEQ